MKKDVAIIIFLFISTFSLNGQSIDSNNYILSGTVVNGSNNKPLSGANLLTSMNYGTKSDEVGEFNLYVYPNDTIKISYVGFKTINYIAPFKENGKYLIKFKMYRDSVSLAEIEIFPWPTYKEFKKAFLAIDKQNEKIEMVGITTYQDKSIEPVQPTILNPASFIYDKLFDKQAKLKRRLKRKRKVIKKSIEID